MVNCGRCGRPIYKPGEVICEFCRKTISKDATRHSARMNRKKEEEEDMFHNIASPDKDEETEEDMHYQHYVDTHDAASVWVDDSSQGKKGKRHRP